MRRLFILPLLFVLAAGCGGQGRPPLATVTGTVTLDDKPIKNGTIVFEAPGLRPATGKIVDGEIVEVTTFEPNDGVPVGNHKVAVFAQEEADSAVVSNPGEKQKLGAGYMGGASTLPARYGDPEKSGFTAEIAEGENTVKFELTTSGK